MFEETLPDPTLRPESATADESRFLVSNRMEIIRILRGLTQHNEMVSAFFNGGNDLLLTAVLEVDPDNNAVILDYGSNEALNQRILSAEKIIFVTALDRVKVQFVSRRIATASHERRPAFRIPLPEQMLRLQRREYYRLATPILNPIKCRMPVGQEEVLEFPLVDISAGGIGMIVGSSPDERLAMGTLYPGCRIELPGIGELEMTLRIQNLFEITLKNGSKAYRAGCQFIELRASVESLIQRYILKLERERLSSNP